MRTKDNGTRWFPDRFSIHLEGMEVVQLFELTSLPFRPGIELPELPASEPTKGLLLRSNSLRLDGTNEEVDLLCGDRGLREVHIRVSGRGNCTKEIHTEKGSVFFFWAIRVEQIMFLEDLLQLPRIQPLLRGQFNVNDFCFGIKESAQDRRRSPRCRNPSG